MDEFHSSENRMRDAVLFLGGSQFDVKGMMVLRSMGIEVVVADRNPDCPAAGVADEFWVVGADDINKIEQWYHESPRRDRIIFAYSGNDFGTCSAAKLNRRILGYEVVGCDPSKTNDKVWLKEKYKSKGLPVPRDIQADSSCDPATVAEHIAATFGFPVVCKPSSGSGARGVSVAREGECFPESWRTAASEGGTVLVEEYVCGSHLDLNGFMVKGRFHRSGSSDRFFLPEPRRVSIKNYAPSKQPTMVMNRAWSVLESAAEALDLQTGPIKGDFIVRENGEPVLLETSLRFHGGLTTFGSMAVSGTSFSLVEILGAIKPKIGQVFERVWQPRGHVGMVHILVDLERGSGVGNYEVPSDMPGIESVFLRDMPKNWGGCGLRDNRDIPGYVVCYGSTREECDMALANAFLKIRCVQ